MNSADKFSIKRFQEGILYLFLVNVVEKEGMTIKSVFIFFSCTVRMEDSEHASSLFTVEVTSFHCDIVGKS